MEGKDYLVGSFRTKNGTQVNVYRNTKNMEKNEIKKDLYKSKNLAKFSHYVNGNLYYKVDVMDGTYQFPIKTVQKSYVMDTRQVEKIPTLVLAEDLGTTTFDAEIKGSELIRWIEKAIDNEDFIKVG
jgi:hypothetical protein